MSDVYRSVIRLLGSDDLNCHELVYKIAELYPEELLDAYVKLYPKPEEPKWVQECKSLVYSGQKVRAIKLCREHTGWDLQASKEYVENL